MASEYIDIFGKFHAATVEGILAEAGEIKDVHFNKTQAELNLEFSENHGGVSSVAGLTGDVLAADLLEALNLDDVVSNVSVLMQRTNWDNYFGIDQQTGAIFVKPIDANTPRGFYSLGYISAGGVGSSGGGGGGGADLLDVWVSLRDNDPNEDFYNWKINPGHIPGLPWSQITSGKPTTLSGYGITDAYTKTQVDNLIGAIDLTPYLLASVAAQTYATITSLEAVSARVSVLEGRTNWDDYLGVDADGNIYVKMNGQNARGFYSDGFIAAGGVGSSGGGGGEGASLLVVWRSLTNNNSLVDADITSTLKIATAHIPDVASVYGYLKHNETITLTGVVTGSGTTTIATSIADGAISISKISGLGAAATYGIGSVESGDNGLVTGGAVYSAIASAVAAEAELRVAADNALSARIAVFEGMFEIVDGNIHVKNNRGFYSDSFIAAGGVGSSSGGGGGADLLDMWVSLRDNTPNEDFYNWKVNAGHLPLGSGLTVDANGNINVGTAGSVAWANVTGKPTTVSGYGITDAVTNASYNSTTKRIELKCANVVISYIDATAFIKDGMVSNVQVTGGYLVISFNTDAGQEDIRIPISDIFNADNYYDKTASDARFFLAANFTAANIVSTIGNTPVARASRLDGDTALSIWGVEYWANGVPKAVSARPGLYIAGTQVNTTANKDTLLGVTAISNGLSSGSSDESRIEWDATNHAWHFYGGIYADTFVTAGGTNASGGGGGSVDLDRVWESLTNNIDKPNVEINTAHIPDLSISKVTGLQTALDGKQATISDLSTIRSNASLGASAYNALPNYVQKGGFSVADGGIASWGTLTPANGYNAGMHFASSDGGDATLSYKNGQIYMQVDGWFYQNEGAYRVLDTSDIGNTISYSSLGLDGRYLQLSGGTMGSGAHITVASVSEYYTGYGNKYTGGIELREYEYAGTTVADNYQYAPGITFHWSGRYVGKLNLYDDKLHWDTNVIWHSGNSNISTVAWSASSLTLAQAGGLNFLFSGTPYDFVSLGSGATVKFGNTAFSTEYRGYAHFFFNSSGSELMRINESGNVGIGTTSPACKLDVAGWAQATNIKVTYHGGTDHAIEGYHGDFLDDHFNIHLGSSSGDFNVMNDNWTPLFRVVRTTGYVGIGYGTTNPSYKLDVSGTFRNTGVYYADVITNGVTSSLYSSAKIYFGTTSHDFSETRYYIPWMGGSDAVNGQGFGNTVLLGAYHSRNDDCGFYIGLSWDGAASDKVFTFSRYGALSVPDTLSVGSSATIGGTLSVTGATTLSGALTVNNTASISGNTTIGGTLTVSGASYLDSTVRIGGTLSVTGATTLSGALTVNNTASISGNTTIGGTLTVTWNTTLNSDLTVYGDTFFHSDIYLYTNMALFLDEYGNNALYYDPTEGTIRFTFDYASHFTDGIYSDSYITAGGVASSSDARLKDNIRSIGYDKAIDMLSRLRGCEWTWNEKKSCLEGKHGSGLIAQEVESVMPWAVLELNGGELSLTYDSFWGVAIPVMQSHEERLQKAERKIAALEAENAELRARLNN